MTERMLRKNGTRSNLAEILRLLGEVVKETVENAAANITELVNKTEGGACSGDDQFCGFSEEKEALR
jgi:hypothetical protein